MRRDEHLALLRARLAEVGSGAAAHGPSAALLHGLELAEVPGEPFIAVPVGRSRPAPGLRRTPLADSVVVAGTRCTPLLRTVADIARTRPLPAALVALDSSLRQRRLLPSQLRQAADAAQGNGRAQLRRAVPLADARAGSPIESLCRGHLLEASIGPVHTQSCLRPDGHAYDMRVRGSRLLIEGGRAGVPRRARTLAAGPRGRCAGAGRRVPRAALLWRDDLRPVRVDGAHDRRGAPSLRVAGAAAPPLSRPRGPSGQTAAEAHSRSRQGRATPPYA